MSDEELHDAVIAIRTNVENLTKQLLGNGRPGEIDVMKGKIEKLQREQDRTAGAVTMARWLAGLTGIGEIVAHMFFMKKS